MKIAVVGAGALGTAAALHLGRRGHEVTLLDRGQVAGGTTGFAAGILSLGVLDEHDRHLVRLTMDGFEALERDFPTEGARSGPLLRRPGSHVLAARGEETRAVEMIARSLRTMREDHELWSPAEWEDQMAERGIEVITAGLATVLSIDRDAWTLSTEATTLMARGAKAAGARLRTSLRVPTLLRKDGRVIGVRTDGGDLEADAVVVAGGAWTRPFLDREGLRLPARAFRTHAAIVRTPLAAAAPIVHDNPAGFYMRPESDQHLLVGDGTKTEPVDPETFTNDAEPYFMENLAEKIPQRFPELADATLQNQWRGVLTGVPDRHPLVGAHPDAPGLYLCTGGNGFGFMRSFALGACLAAALDQDTVPARLPPDTLAWMDPARFWPEPPGSFEVYEGFQLLPHPEPAPRPRSATD